jgi:hypothetical protein
MRERVGGSHNNNYIKVKLRKVHCGAFVMMILGAQV